MPIANLCPIDIRIQPEDFDLGDEYRHLQQGLGTQVGAIATFVGLVREFAEQKESGGPADLYLEHYPGMTEKVLQRIAEQARERWPLLGITVIHRIGQLAPGAQIVLVAVAAQHRAAAFEACAFIMDYLKTQAPFWKKEGNLWVAAKSADQRAADAWADPS